MSTAAANALTARWASTLDGEQTVLSGAGVQPLLALLARQASGPARTELLAVGGENAIGPELAGSPTTRLALGTWTRAGLPLTARWLAEVPDSIRGELTGNPAVDQPMLDEWATGQTGGLIPTMPIAVSRDTLLVLASALSVVTDWAAPFREQRYRPHTGPWQGRELVGLVRRTPDLTALRGADTPIGPLTLLTVRGDADVDVLLALGAPEHGAAQVLPAAIAALGDGPMSTPTSGPGVSTESVQAYDDRPELAVHAVRFTVQADHDLLRNAELFGLATATSAGTGHFPGISPVPLAVSQARQSVTATFGATGFKAAVVTAIATRAGSLPPPATRTKQLVRVEFDRPFGFVAVHRPTGLVLVAGWIVDPDAYPTR